MSVSVVKASAVVSMVSVLPIGLCLPGAFDVRTL